MEFEERVFCKPPKKEKGMLIASIFLLTLTFVSFFIAFVVTAIVPYHDESNTRQHNATVISAEWNHAELFIVNVQHGEIFIIKPFVINWFYVNNIRQGQDVVFRVPHNTDFSQLNFISPVTLTIGDVEFATFESSNANITRGRFGGRLSGSIFGTLFLVASIICFLIHKKIIFKKKLIR